MTGEDAEKYMDCTWKEGGTGPDEWDCWHFLQHVLMTYFGKCLPNAPIGDHFACKQIFETEVRAGRWERVQDPQHGDAVSMREGDWPHVGIYLDIDGGRVLHCCEDHDVVASRLSTLRTAGFGRLKFYRIHNQ